MGIFTINTCNNVGIDPDTGYYFCKVDHLNPSGAHDVGGLVDGGSLKTIPICLPLRVWGKKMGSGNIKKVCDKANEVKASIF